LHHRGHRQPEDNQDQHAEQARPPPDVGTEHSGQIRRVQLFSQSAHPLLQRREPKQDQRKPGKRCPCCRHASTPQQLDQGARENHRECGGGERHANTDQRDEPAGSRRADIRSEDQRQPF
jgi:hypothetical protein